MHERAWHVRDGRKSKGPFSELELLRDHFAGRLPATTMVRRDSDADWTPLSEALPLDALTPPPLPLRQIETPLAIGATKVGAWIDNGAYAWRRYFARQLDILLGAMLMFAAASAVLSVTDGAYSAYSAFTGIGNRFVLNVAGVLLAAIPSALLIGATGTSVGKLIFGLRVLDAERRPPGVLRALRREFQLTLQGLGLGIPLISLITLIGGYSHLHSEGAARWDTDNDLVTWYRAPSFAHAVLMLLGILSVVTVMAIVVARAANA